MPEDRRPLAVDDPLSPHERDLMDAWWRAANYLSVGQIYLLDNPLLKRPLTLDHIKPRLLGHWGTTPGLNFLYVHLNRVIKARAIGMAFVAGPGHGGPGIVANAWLEGTYSEIYPHIPQNALGMQRLFKQFSFPGGIPSHAAPETPGSIHEGGELGYALSHAYGAVFDNPDLVVACVIGDGEAETGPMATSWHSNKFLDAATDGAVLPILHLNGYKIANPTILARIGAKELESLFIGYGYKPYVVEGDDPAIMHQVLARTLDAVFDEIRDIQVAARRSAAKGRPIWPMIILKTPKGWTGPKEVDGLRTEGFWRAHQVPVAEMATKPEHIKVLEDWMKGYRPAELFDGNGTLNPEIAALAPTGDRRMSANPHANGGLLMRELDLPEIDDYSLKVDKPGATLAGGGDHGNGCLPSRCDKGQRRTPQFPFVRSRRGPFEPPRTCFGGNLTGHGRPSVCRTTSISRPHVWRQDHNGFSHQDPGFIDYVCNKKPDVVRVYLPPDANSLLFVIGHCLRSWNRINVIVAGKQPEPQWLTLDQAVKHCTAGIGIWEWASNDRGFEPDVVMACAGDVPTLETLAAVDLLHKHIPQLKVRVVNVVDLMSLQPHEEHPHGLTDQDFDALFTADKPVIFAHHGYPWLVHRLTYRRTNHHNIHVRGYKEEGTTTTPFDMVVRNHLDRFHLVSDVIDRLPQLGYVAAYAKQAMRDKLIEHQAYTCRHGEDMPEVKEWRWTPVRPT